MPEELFPTHDPWAVYHSGMPEVSLLLHQKDSFRRALLGRYYRTLNLDACALDFTELEQIVSDKPYSLGVGEVLARTKEKINLRKGQLCQDCSIEEDLRQVVSQSPATEPEAIGSPAWIAVQAGLARLYVESKRYSDAAAIYQRLLACAEQFPEAQRGLKMINA